MDIVAEAERVRSSAGLLKEKATKTNSSLANFEPTELQVVIMNVNIVTSLLGVKPVRKHEIIAYFDSGANSMSEISLKRDRPRKRKRDESKISLGEVYPFPTQTTKPNRDHVDFANCVTLVYEGKLSPKKHVSIKVYNNGKLQISGCKTIDDALLIANVVCSFLSNMFLVPVAVDSFNIACINVACYIHKLGNRKNSIDLKQIENGLVEKGYWSEDGRGPLQSVQLSADISPAIIIRYKKDNDPNASLKQKKGLTAMVYRCGYMKFAGLKKHTDAIAFYKFMVEFLDTKWSSIAKNV